MKHLTISAVLLLALAAVSLSQSFIDSTTFHLTTNAASRAILVTNFTPYANQDIEWFPASVLLVNRGADTTGEWLRLEHLRTAQTNLVYTNGYTTLTQTIAIINSAATITATNWFATAGEHWYICPTNDRLQIQTVCTNGEIILTREHGR